MAPFRGIQVIHPRAAQAAVAEDEAAGFDDLDRQIQARGEPQQRADILRDIRLKQGEGEGFGQGANSAAAGGQYGRPDKDLGYIAGCFATIRFFRYTGAQPKGGRRGIPRRFVASQAGRPAPVGLI